MVKVEPSPTEIEPALAPSPSKLPTVAVDFSRTKAFAVSEATAKVPILAVALSRATFFTEASPFTVKEPLFTFREPAV